MATSETGTPAPAGRTAERRSPRLGRFRRYMREVGWRYVVAALALFFALFPVAWVVTSAINPLNTLTTVSFLPQSTTFDNFTSLFEGCNWSLGVPPFECPNTTTPFPLWLWNTVKIALLATTIQLILSALAAYSFSRLRWRGRR